jgi:hypothetical protein
MARWGGSPDPCQSLNVSCWMAAPYPPTDGPFQPPDRGTRRACVPRVMRWPKLGWGSTERWVLGQEVRAWGSEGSDGRGLHLPLGGHGGKGNGAEGHKYGNERNSAGARRIEGQSGDISKMTLYCNLNFKNERTFRPTVSYCIQQTWSGINFRSAEVPSADT